MTDSGLNIRSSYKTRSNACATSKNMAGQCSSFYPNDDDILSVSLISTWWIVEPFERNPY